MSGTPSAPTVSASFASSPINVGATTNLTITLTNPNAGVALTGVALASANLPASVRIGAAATSAVCTGGGVAGTLTAAAATQAIAVSGATIAASSTCTYTIPIEGVSAAGAFNYTTGAPSATGPSSVTGVAAATSNTLTVNALPVPVLTFATPTAASVTLGGALTNAATSTLTGGGFGAITYASSNTGVATVNGSGVITTASAGTTTITATQAAVAGVNAQATQTYVLTVNPLPVPVLTFATQTAASVTLGGALTNAATSTLTGGGFGAISYASSNTGVATVNGSGVITTASVGTTTITATQAAVAGVNAQATQTYTLTVTEPVPVLTFATPTAASVTLGGALTNAATSTLTGGGFGAISYASSNTGVATVDGSGVITTVSAGTTTITATQAAVAGVNAQATQTYVLTVNPLPVPVLAFATPTAASVTLGGALTNAATSTLTGGGFGAISYASSNTGVATVDGSGVITTVSVGTTTITATQAAVAGVNAQATQTYVLTVNALPVPVLTFATPTAASVTLGGALTNAATSTLTGGGFGAISYASSNTGVATVDGSGVITTVSAGTTTITATQAAVAGVNAQATQTYVLTVTASSMVLSPAGGNLPDAMAGEAYSQPISASGGVGVLIYSVASGALPNGMVLNVSTGELTGPLAAGTEGAYEFTIQVRDGNGNTVTGTYRLTVTPRVVSVSNTQVDVPGGTAPPNVALHKGATGGPFLSAAVVFVEPPFAGSATIIRGEFAQVGPAPLNGWFLQFTPNPEFSGQARVGFKLTSELGVSNTGVVTYILGVDTSGVSRFVDGLVKGFVKTRQSLVASTIKVPGLVERRRMQADSGAIRARMSPSSDGVTLGVSTSLAQIEAAKAGADGEPSEYHLPYNIWIDGTLMAHNREANDNQWGGFGMLSLGADYLISEKALVGVSFHADWMSDPSSLETELQGNGWLAGPYASVELGKNVFLNASLLYGESSNDIDTRFWDGSFDSTRYIADVSINGQWDLGNDVKLTPQLRSVYSYEKVEDYTVTNSAGNVIAITGFEEEQFRLSLGAEIERSFTLDSDATVTPKLGLTGGFSGLDGSGAFVSVSAGMSMLSANDWVFNTDLLFNLREEGEASAGARVRANKRF